MHVFKIYSKNERNVKISPAIQLPINVNITDHIKRMQNIFPIFLICFSKSNSVFRNSKNPLTIKKIGTPSAINLNAYCILCCQSGLLMKSSCHNGTCKDTTIKMPIAFIKSSPSILFLFCIITFIPHNNITNGTAPTRAVPLFHQLRLFNIVHYITAILY